jgi:hypothetical protein
MTSFYKRLSNLHGNFKPQDKEYWNNHDKIVDHISSGKGMCKDLFNDVLFIKPIVTDKHIALCDTLLAQKYVLPIPITNTPNYLLFESVFDTRYVPYTTNTPGCYRILDTENGSSYVGQSKSLGARVYQHANSKSKYLNRWIVELHSKNTGLVEMYRLPTQDRYHGLTPRQFLSVMEMYLFLVHNFSKNRSFLALPG